MALQTLHPDFVASTDKLICRAIIETPSEVSIRLNPLKPYSFPYSDRVAWAAEGLYLDHRPSFTLDPAFAAGAYYVQEASSMFVGWIFDKLDLVSDPLVLDLCAAPGGKSTLLSSKIGFDGVLVANEVIRARSSVLAQNVQKWGDGNTIVTSADASAFGAMGAMFDLLLIDAPCSGEGMFRKDELARAEWSLEGVERCAARQRRIVANVWDSLREGGYLIYSTCTFNASENERNVLWIAEQLGGQIVDFDISELVGSGISKNPTAGYNFYPHLVRGEGFYAAVIRKTRGTALGGGSYKSSSSVARNGGKIKVTRISPCDSYTKRPMLYVTQGEALRAYSTSVMSTVERLREGRIYMLSAGVELGVEIRGELKPSHELALYSGLGEALFPRANLSLDSVLQYLRKGTIEASGLTNGVNLICYDGLPVGFAKRIGGRVNNMYPTSWRVLR